MSWGPPAGTPFGGAGGGAGGGGGAGAGLPFAGVPPELAERAARVLATEPDHPEPDVTFSHHLAAGDPDAEPFTLRSFLRPVAGPVALAIGLVVVETATLQAGPLLTQIGIDRGISAGDFGVVLAMAGLFLAAVALNVVASGVRISYTGRLGERLMEALRIRVFAHLQRLSLDYYTGERSGRVMTRMTSDIDALTALFQDGLVNLAVQGLTLVIITVVLVWMSPMLALITIGVVVPVMLVLTLWFRRASERAYGEVRDRIADVLTDLAESLAGIRVIAAHNRRDRNVATHEGIVDDHLQANLTTARVGAIYGPASDGVGIAGQAVVLGVGVMVWVAGFDILYACQDEEFDRARGLHSIPVRLGAAGALALARVLHVLAMLGFVGFALGTGRGAAFYAGLAGAGLLLAAQHRLVRPGDLARIDMAFFTMNGSVGLLLLVATAADLYLFGG